MNPNRRRYERSDPDRTALATEHARTAPLRYAKRSHTIAKCARISIQSGRSHRIASATPCLSESPNARSACWSVRWSAHRERCGAGPSEFQEACRKGPMHTPHEAGTGLSLHKASTCMPCMHVKGIPSSCSHAWGFKHYSNNYKAPSCLFS